MSQCSYNKQYCVHNMEVNNQFILQVLKANNFENQLEQANLSDLFVKAIENKRCLFESALIYAININFHFRL